MSGCDEIVGFVASAGKVLLSVVCFCANFWTSTDFGCVPTTVCENTNKNKNKNNNKIS